MDNKKTYPIREEVLNSILQYLATKPYQEVVSLIGQMQQDVQAAGVQQPTLDEPVKR